MALATAPPPPPSSLLFLSSSSSPSTTTKSSLPATTFPRSPPLCLSIKTHHPLFHRSSPPLFFPCAALQEPTTVGADEGTSSNRRKLYVANLPWTYSASDIESLFGQCGVVKDVEVIAQKNGKSRGFVFVTMDTEEEAGAAIDKFDSYELLERIIRVEYAKSLKKPAPQPPPVRTSVQETRHLVYASNLAWKVRSSNLRELFSASFKPVSVRVVFDSPSGKSAGYGFVSFATKEEAETAVSELNGKELMGRPLRLKMSEKRGDETGTKAEHTDNTEVRVS